MYDAASRIQRCSFLGELAHSWLHQISDPAADGISHAGARDAGARTADARAAAAHGAAARAAAAATATATCDRSSFSYSLCARLFCPLPPSPLVSPLALHQPARLQGPTPHARGGDARQPLRHVEPPLSARSLAEPPDEPLSTTTTLSPPAADLCSQYQPPNDRSRPLLLTFALSTSHPMIATPKKSRGRAFSTQDEYASRTPLLTAFYVCVRAPPPPNSRASERALLPKCCTRIGVGAIGARVSVPNHAEWPSSRPLELFRKPGLQPSVRCRAHRGGLSAGQNGALRVKPAYGNFVMHTDRLRA